MTKPSNGTSKLRLWLRLCGPAFIDPTFAAGFALWLAWQVLREIVPRIFVFLSATLLALVLVWPVPLAAKWDEMSRLATNWKMRAVITLGCGIIGTLLYITRETMRTLYGIAEILVGLAACWVAIGQSSKSGIEGAITLGSGLYIIVRGFDNIGKAKKEKAEAKAKAEEEERKRAATAKQVPAELWRMLVSPYAIPPENPFRKILAETKKNNK
ncbi:MAG: hypothetical protein QOJ64_3389 [Acidobacteriota bacterium]|jgi:hypothetical protein|nr:hypothetical protein [Acidobacteriota bacterium]